MNKFKSLLKLAMRWTFVAKLIFQLLLLLAKLQKIPTTILNRSKIIAKNESLYEANGFIYWFLCLKFGKKLPSTFKPYKHLKQGDEKNDFTRLLDDFVATEKNQSIPLIENHACLRGLSIENEDVRTAVSKLLQDSLNKRISSYKPRNKFFNRLAAEDALDDLKQLLDSINIEFFLISGTLLSLVRNGRLSDNDYDIDVGIMPDQVVKFDQIVDLLGKSDDFQSVTHQKNLIIFAVHKNGVTIDIFSHFVEGNYIWHGSNIHKWYNSKFELTKVKFESGDFLVPNNREVYLNENYGNWSDPVIFWRTTFDTPNRVYQHDLTGLFFLVNIVIKELDKESPCRFSLSSALHELKENFDLDFTKHLPISKNYFSDELKGVSRNNSTNL